ncbi:MAG: recombinase family protein [Verrucomicrobiae bacterium]|nr:recombinase family protein [Verrucomicrobiae bacterium]
MDEIKRKPITYGIYIRKSSESEDRQVQSLVRQKTELREIVDRDGLVVHQQVFEERQSAFRTGREVFSELVDATRKGEVNAWLTWHANRLSRNPVDGGQIIHLMDEGFLDHIRTRERIYENTPQDKLMLHFEFGLSKNDSEEKSKIVRSGIKRRHERGYPSGVPPIGFLLAGSSASSGRSFWVLDKPQWKLLRQVFQRFLAGRDSVLTITNYARFVGLRTTLRGRSGGRFPTRSTIHRILTNPIYAGYFITREGIRYELEKQLPRLITEEEFNRIRIILGDHNSAKERTTRPSAFGGLITTPQGETLGTDHKFHLVCDCGHKFSHLHTKHCPRCGSEIAGLSRPRFRSYVYYYSLASRRRTVRPLRSIEERRVRDLARDHIRENLNLPDNIKQWAIRYLPELQDQVLRNRQREAERHAKFQQDLKEKRRRLTELYLDGLITKKDYEQEARSLAISGATVKSSPDFTLSVDWKKEATQILDLVGEMDLILQHGNAGEVKQAMESLGIQMVWDGEELKFNHSTKLRRLMAIIEQGRREMPAAKRRKTSELDDSGTT